MSKTTKILHQQAQQALNQGLYQQAHQKLIAILQQDKYFADAYFLLAMIASAHHNFLKAIELIKQANKLAPNNAEYLSQLAKHYALENNHVQAVYFAELTAQLASKSSLTLDTLGVAYSKIGLHEKAVIFFQQAVTINDKNPNYFFNLGAALKFIGDFDGAKKAYEKTIAIAPNYYKAHAALTGLGGISATSNHIPLLEQLFSQTQHADDSLYIGHALAREYEALKDFDKAFFYLDTAKKSKLKQFNYHLDEDKALFSRLESHFKNVDSSKVQGFETDEPIFVVGMPRSGTTLVERIISQHSEVTSAGELQHFGLLLKKMAKTTSKRVIDAETIAATENINFAKLGEDYIESTRAITGKTEKFVDKMPLNVLYVGFILKALPKAKIVCLDRNPLDTIVSNFRQLFAVNQSYYSYSYDLESTTEFYLLFKQLAALWLALFPENFYLINYEKLVNDPVNEAKQLIEFCNLSWQEQCVDIDQNSAPVATASAMQVRSPINNRSVGNWKKYDAYLDGVKAILATREQT
ncbi:sulfotransferase [Colwellia sp. MB3u-70]|uniref:tetratricopeptide repeat-containing sulfotransferase family protein n=1 Tax=unclassified Colwellia TaxID=196834 RepID=UPI0015F6B1CE|nr:MULTISPECIES: sulfotransferase [unclassified Colwellia]MBA6290755.1 sulfotransferase [Colwellia sp. MB3u-8]MBA6306239.1 sulfotransferase [Colwellia sp. MB3u-70]